MLMYLKCHSIYGDSSDFLYGVRVWKECVYRNSHCPKQQHNALCYAVYTMYRHFFYCSNNTYCWYLWLTAAALLRPTAADAGDEALCWCCFNLLLLLLLLLVCVAASAIKRMLRYYHCVRGAHTLLAVESPPCRLRAVMKSFLFMHYVNYSTHIRPLSSIHLCPRPNPFWVRGAWWLYVL